MLKNLYLYFEIILLLISNLYECNLLFNKLNPMKYLTENPFITNQPYIILILLNIQDL